MSLKEEVENPMWFTKQVEVNEDFTKGYNTAVYQIRMMLSHNNEPSPEVRRYTEFMIDELNNYRKQASMKQQKAVEWLFGQLYEKFEMKGDGREMDKILEKAITMEDEQRDKAYSEGVNDARSNSVKYKYYNNNKQTT